MNEFSQQQSLPEINATAGAILASARRSANMSVSEVATQLRRGVNQVEALEADDYQRLPGATFVRGLIRNYAKLVNIDAEPVIKAYEAAVPREDVPKIGLESSHIRFQGVDHGLGLSQMKAPSPGLIGMGIVGLVAAVGLWFYSSDRMPKPADTATNAVVAEQSPISGPDAAPQIALKQDVNAAPNLAPMPAIPSSTEKTLAEKAADARAVAEKLAQEKTAADKVAAEKAQEENCSRKRSRKDSPHCSDREIGRRKSRSRKTSSRYRRAKSHTKSGRKSDGRESRN
jgi:cytoskeleton protein RodZ